MTGFGRPQGHPLWGINDSMRRFNSYAKRGKELGARNCVSSISSSKRESGFSRSLTRVRTSESKLMRRSERCQ